MGLSPADLDANEKTQAIEDALTSLEDAIRNEGLAPSYHHRVMARQRAEWPTLWAAIDQLLAASARNGSMARR